MSQSFIELQGDTTLTESRSILNNNADALKTDFSGITAPFTASEDTLGATYYNTSDKKVYRVVAYGSGYTWRAENDNIPTVENGTISNEAANAEFVTKSVNKSNCITEIPQDIKLELSSGTLTLKAGSILTSPDGTQATTSVDKTTTLTTNGQYLLFVDAIYGNFQLSVNHKVTKCGSGSSLPADNTTYNIFLNTTDLKIYRWNSNAWVTWGVALPIGIITVSDGNISSIDQVFNGAGYIGHHAFILPDIKGLAPNGFNSDGTYKNTTITINSLAIREMSTGQSVTGIDRAIASNAGWSGYKEVNKYTDADFTKGWIRYYVKEDNKIYTYNGSSVIQESNIPLVFYNYNGTSVTRFDIKPVFQAVDYSEVPKLNTDNTFTGNNTFTADELALGVNGTKIKSNQGGIELYPQSTANNGGYIDFHYNGSSSDYTSRIIENGSGTLTLLASNGVNAPTPSSATDNSTKVATTAWKINNDNTQRTNCITEIPQDIKLSLNNGTLTLKAGSVLTDPQGGTQRTTTQDQTGTLTTNGQYMVFADRTTGALQLGSGCTVAKIGSGSTLPADGSTFNAFYNSTDGKIYRWDGSSWVAWGVAFPLGIITVSSGAISSIDQVFNGFGYIGSTVFVLPGVKGLAANGRNNDGTLKSSSVNVASLLIRTVSSAQNTKEMAFTSSGIALNTFSYNEEANYLYDVNNTQRANTLVVGPVEFSQSSPYNVIKFNPKTAFHAVDYYDLIQTNSTIDTLDSQNAKLTGDQTIAGTKTFSNTIVGNISGNAATVTNGVYTNGNQTIAGNKTFSGNTTFNNKISGNISGHADLDAQLTANNTFTGNNLFANITSFTSSIDLKNTSLATNGTTPSSDLTFPVHFKANDNSVTGYIRSRQRSNGTYILDLVCRTAVSGTAKEAGVQVYIESNGTSYATAPTPTSATDNSTKIATTAWFNMKVKRVSTLPASPESGVYYFI